MVKMTQVHIDAICHAELFFDPIFAKLESPRLRKHLEDDLLRLAEIKLYIMTIMAKGPQFPSMKDDEPDDPSNSKSRP